MSSEDRPRITSDHIHALVRLSNVFFYRFPDTTLTVCCIQLPTGFCTTGTSACVSPENYDKEVGEAIALENATNTLWELEGYRLTNGLTND